MSEWEDRINSILGDPAQMAEIERLAQSLMGGGSGGTADAEPLSASPGGEGPDPTLLARLSALMRSDAESGREKALLEAMKPYLSDKRRGKLDRAMKLARMARLAGLALGEGEGGDV